MRNLSLLAALSFTTELIFSSFATAQDVPSDTDHSWMGVQRVSNSTGILLCAEDDFNYALSVKREYCTIALNAPNITEDQRGAFELAMCRTSILSGELEQADAECRRSLLSGDRSVDKLQYIVEVSKKLRNYDAVVEFSRELISLRPDVPKWWRSLLDGLMGAGRLGEGLVEIEAYGERFDKDHYYIFQKYRLNSVLGRHSESTDLAKLMKTTYVNLPLGEIMLSEIALRQGDVAAAMNHLEAANRMAPIDPSVSPRILSLVNIPAVGEIYSEFHLKVGVQVFSSAKNWEQAELYSTFLYFLDNSKVVYSQSEIRELNAVKVELASQRTAREELQIAAIVGTLKDHFNSLELLIKALERDTFDCQSVPSQDCAERIAVYVENVYVLFAAAAKVADSILRNSVWAPAENARSIAELERSTVLMELYRRGFDLNTERQSVFSELVSLEVSKRDSLDKLLFLQLESIWNVKFYIGFYSSLSDELIASVDSTQASIRELSARLSQLDLELEDIDAKVSIALSDKLWGYDRLSESSSQTIANLTEIQRMFVSVTGYSGSIADLLVSDGGQRGSWGFDPAAMPYSWQGTPIVEFYGGIGWATFVFDESSSRTHATCLIDVDNAYTILADVVGGSVGVWKGPDDLNRTIVRCRDFDRQLASDGFAYWGGFGQFFGMAGYSQYDFSRFGQASDFIRAGLE